MARASAQQATAFLKRLCLLMGLLPTAACTVPQENQAPLTKDVEAPMELAYWEAVVDSGDPAAYEAYLESYPDGHFRALAQLRLEAAQAAAEDPDASNGQMSSASLATESSSDPSYGAYQQTPPDDIRVARARSNVRRGPGTDHRIIGKLDSGEEVIVMSEVDGRDWYKVGLANGTIGFVYAPLLVSSARASSRVAYGLGISDGRREEERLAWERLRDSDDWLDYQRYLWVYGDQALYAPEARWRRNRLKTGQEPRLATEELGNGLSHEAGTAVAATEAAALVEAPPTDESTAAPRAPGQEFDGPWNGIALTRFGTQCKSSYDINLMVAEQQINGAMMRNTDRFWVNGYVDDVGGIENLKASSDRVVTFLVLSATQSEIKGRWSMSAKHNYGGSPCSGSFTLYPA